MQCEYFFIHIFQFLISMAFVYGLKLMKIDNKNKWNLVPST